MATAWKCCVRNCETTRYEKIPMHCFPHPEKDPARFWSWLNAIGGNLLTTTNELVYKNARVCHKHFEPKFKSWCSKLINNAIPTLELKGPTCKRTLADITNQMVNNSSINEPSTSTGEVLQPPPKSPPPITSGNQAVCSNVKEPRKKNVNLEKTIKKLQNKKDNYATRLKKALKLNENITFQKYLQKFSTLAAIFTVMQFREINKPKMGRRFSNKEKIMALSLYKQGPKAYRWLSKIFILPSPLTLSRLISKAGLRPGLNKKIFDLLKKRVQKMTENEKLCILMFDEIAIKPHFDFNRKRDSVTGYVTNGQETKRKIADHALVFMLRGVLKNYKQPITYTFCKGATPKGDLKALVKNVISELQKCGLKVLATVCDQGTANISTINSLIEDTRINYLRANKDFKNNLFEINEQEIVPLFDPPHLIKGIRNNLITKDLKCVIDNEVKIAKWDHIQKLHEENPSYKGIKLIKKLTEAHVDPRKISKMKVKIATQVLSKTVATNMGYLADKGILPPECKDTADVFLFFDELFDSVNGSYYNSKKRSGKILLQAVTPKSDHAKVWTRAKQVLKSMKFVTKDGKEGSVPSITNWLRTLENIEILKNKLFNDHSIKSIWMRHFNQDPLENFFGCIRAHGCRNISPTASGFESAFASLLINNISGNHSVGANCEKDDCKIFKSMETLISNVNVTEKEVPVEVDLEDLDIEIVDYSEKVSDVRIKSQLTYVAGYLLKAAKKKGFIQNCDACKSATISKDSDEYLMSREFSAERKSLTYPSVSIIKLFSGIQDIAIYLLEKKSNMIQIKTYMKTLMLISLDFSFLVCPNHKNSLVDFIFDLGSRFFIYNWCKDINKLLDGSKQENIKTADDIINEASEYYKKRNKMRIKMRKT